MFLMIYPYFIKESIIAKWEQFEVSTFGMEL